MERIVKGIFIPLEIWESRDLSWSEKVLLMEIDSFTSKGMDCYFSNDYIAEKLGVTDISASRLVNSLIRKGYIRQTRFDGRKRYLESCICYQCRVNENVKADLTKMITQHTQKCEDNNTNNKQSNTNKVFDFRKALLDAGVEPSVADTWLNVRKKRNAVNSELAWNEIKREIEKSGRSANECIMTAAAQSWRGFKAEWISNRQPAPAAKRPASPDGYNFIGDWQ